MSVLMAFLALVLLGCDKPKDEPSDPQQKPEEVVVDPGKPGGDAGEKQDEGAGVDPGKEPGEDLGENPGENPGEEPGEDPGENPGTEPIPGEGDELPCTIPPTVGEVPLDQLSGYGKDVTGGEGSGAKVLHFNNGKALQTWLLQ